MSILIKGMEMPIDGPMIFAIRPDGMVEDVMGCYVGKAIPVPPRGRLIDADALSFVESENGCQDDCVFRYDINEMPTVIPAE